MRSPLPLLVAAALNVGACSSSSTTADAGVVDAGDPARFLLAPAFVNGACVGFTLTHVEPGSRYANAGLRTGDVLLRINGMALDHPDRGLEAYQMLESPHLVMDIERDGKRTTLVFDRE